MMATTPTTAKVADDPVVMTKATPAIKASGDSRMVATKTYRLDAKLDSAAMLIDIDILMLRSERGTPADATNSVVKSGAIFQNTVLLTEDVQHLYAVTATSTA